MVHPKILPLENMTGMGGWALYLFGTGLILTAIVWAGKGASVWLYLVRETLNARRRGGRSLVKPWEVAHGVIMLLVLAVFVWVFVRMVVIQLVQEVRFGNQRVELVYRFPWLDQWIAYNSIERLQLKNSPPALTLPGAHPRGGFPLMIVVITRAKTYEIESESGVQRERLKAIYAEIKRRIATHENVKVTQEGGL